MQSVSAVLASTEFQLLSFDQIASLWSNYGHIYRLHLSTQPHLLILKVINPPSVNDPSESHLRKLLSYEVERWFYRHLSSSLPLTIKISKFYPTTTDERGSLLLEDLSPAYPFSAGGSLGKDATLCVLDWLAGFHATFFRCWKDKRVELVPPPNPRKEARAVNGVWKRGTYFYLETRREELEEIDQEMYQWLLPWVEKVNTAIDHEIERYGTLVHGDAKGANIIFNTEPNLHRKRKQASTPPRPGSFPLHCALYDMQYVGLGLPTLDLVYFLGTSVESSLLSEASEKELLDHYFATFAGFIDEDAASATSYPFSVFLTHWELAIVDWYRFMVGWGFWGNDTWVERRAKKIVSGWAAQPPSWHS